ncbi:MAG TPA: DinB family protein [Longimicrobium sp.]|nr:DinB family protein [Longimicrobium sp.]
MRAHLERLFRHMAWADQRVLALLAAIPDDPQPEPRRLFSHVLAAERVWLLRLRGEDSVVQPIWPMYSLEELAELARRNREEYARYLEGCGDDALAAEVEYRNTQGTEFRTAVSDVLLQVFLHGAYHRGQIAAAVRGAGREPVNTDFITFAREPAPSA